MATAFATAAMAAALDAVKALCNSGTLVIYQGSQPATPETAIGANNDLVTFTFSSTAFGSDSLSGGNEQATASFTSSSVSPTRSGTAGFARVWQTGGTTPVGDFTVGTSGTDIVLGSTTISTGVPVNLTSFVLKAGPAA
jgi:hypothetical protein